MRRARRRDELAKLRAELEEARPFLALAREIRDEVGRIGADGPVTGARLAEAIEAIPTRERTAMAQSVFARLSVAEQWAVIERVFGDAEIREALAFERHMRAEQAARILERQTVLADVRLRARLDTRTVRLDEVVTIGLFRERDVRAALARGSGSTTCARRVVLRVVGPEGEMQVIEDVFNPGGAYFVTADYDEETWRSADRLDPNERVRVGSIASAGAGFQPVLHLGGRVDVERAGVAVAGRLHMGFVMIGDEDLSVQGDSGS